MALHRRSTLQLISAAVFILLSFTLAMFGTPHVQALPASQGCTIWDGVIVTSMNDGVGYGFSGPLTFNRGEVLVMTFSLNTATIGRVSIREPIGTIRAGPVNFTTGTVTLRWRIPADGDYRVWAANEHASDGTVSVSVRCNPVPDPLPHNPGSPSFCNLDDGRINRNDCDASAAIYQLDDSVQVYGIHPESAEGGLALVVPISDIEAAGVPTDENLLLAEGVNPATGTPITLWRLTTGELQVNAYLHDGKPYVVTWYPDNPWDYERLE